MITINLWILKRKKDLFLLWEINFLADYYCQYIFGWWVDNVFYYFLFDISFFLFFYILYSSPKIHVHFIFFKKKKKNLQLQKKKKNDFYFPTFTFIYFYICLLICFELSLMFFRSQIINVKKKQNIIFFSLS